MPVIEIVMPQLGETVAEGTVLEWKYSVGDSVPADSVLLEVESDKAAIEVPTPTGGVLTGILINPGQSVPVGTVLAQLEVISNETVSSRRTGGVTYASDAQAETREASSHGYGDPGRTSSDRPSNRMSPAVRRLLERHGLEAATIPPTGRGGRLTKADVLAYIATPETVENHTDAPWKADPVTVPFNRYRRLTAKHMVRSKATSPHVLQAVEVDFSGVMKARDFWQASPRSDALKLSILPFVAFAVCRTLGEYPKLNSSVDGDALRIHPAVNLAIAVDLAHQGLVAPVVHGASDMEFGHLALALAAVAAKAKAGKTSPEELTGGTYTISNSGGYGTYITAPIINQPQVAILSLDGISKRPIVLSQSGEDAIGIRPIGILAQCFDHRAVDGAYSAAFLQALKRIVENRDWLALIKGMPDRLNV